MMPEFYQFELFRQQHCLTHLVTTKSIHFPYHFSLALHTGEDQDLIAGNREILARHLHTHKDLYFISANQVHSNQIHIIDKKQTRGWENAKDAVADCDALVTDLPDVILTILTADCVPVLLYDRQKHIIAAIHAGWRGTKQHIVQKTVLAMHKHFGSNPKEIIAGIGPSIGACCYEVEREVAKYFFDFPEAYRQINQTYMLDLPYINKIQLLSAGLKETDIEMSNLCTSCNTNRFFSYRKEQGCSGRFMSIIGLKGKNENKSIL